MLVRLKHKKATLNIADENIKYVVTLEYSLSVSQKLKTTTQSINSSPREINIYVRTHICTYMFKAALSLTVPN